MDIATGKRFRNRRMLIFKKGIDFEIDKDNLRIKVPEKNQIIKIKPNS